MGIIEWRQDGGVAVVSMNAGENRHNPEFIAALLKTLAEIQEEESPRSVVLTSTDPRSWSQGADVEWLQRRMAQQDQQAVRDFLFAVNELLIALMVFPMPVIAAINGHAVGNGLILACACDFRLMRADRGFAIIPGVDLGLLFLPGMLEVVKKAIPRPLLDEMKLTGGRFDAATLARHGVVREAVDGRDAVLERAVVFARGFDKRRAVFGETKRRLNAGILRTMNDEDPVVIAALDVMRS